MKTIIRKIRNKIQRLLKSPTNVLPENVVVEISITGYNIFNVKTCEYNIERVDKDYSKFKALLTDLYQDVLHEDKNWHFFLEGDYNILRFSLKFQPRVEEILKMYNAIYDNNDFMSVKLWIDEQEITRTYQKHFMKIFHEYSVIAITIEDYTTHKLTMLADRIIHCFFNHQFINFQKELNKNCNLEANITTLIAAERAFYIGTLVAYKKAYIQAKKDAGKEYEERVSNMRNTLEKIEKIADVNAVELEDLKLRVEKFDVKT